MFFAVPKRPGIALNLDAVPILPLDVADDNSFALRDIGRLDGGRELSIVGDSMKFQDVLKFSFVCVAFALTWKRHRFSRSHGNVELVRCNPYGLNVHACHCACDRYQPVSSSLPFPSASINQFRVLCFDIFDLLSAVAIINLSLIELLPLQVNNSVENRRSRKEKTKRILTVALVSEN